jgi:hypothetical protein
MKETKKQIAKVTVWLAAFSLLTAPVHAQYSSPSYRVDEAFFGAGGEVDMSSDQFRAHGSAGSLGVGSSESDNFRAEAGFLTPSEPFLEMVVTGAEVNFGELDESVTSYGDARNGDCDCSFYVRSYLSSSYTVITVSDPPTNESGAALAAKLVLGAPSIDPSVEEFGMNLVENTDPSPWGKDPFNDPDNTYADGTAAADYSTPDQFKYGVGDVVAQSPSDPNNPGVGKTDYTVSYIAKSNRITSAGFFRMYHDLVVVATY